jgi:hypothetical protein
MGLWISGNVAARNPGDLGSIPVGGELFLFIKNIIRFSLTCLVHPTFIECTKQVHSINVKCISLSTAKCISLSSGVTSQSINVSRVTIMRDGGSIVNGGAGKPINVGYKA